MSSSKVYALLVLVITSIIVLAVVAQPVTLEPVSVDDDSTTVSQPTCEIIGKTGVKLSDVDCDKIPDLLDDCPLEPEIINAHLDFDGCPDEKPQPKDEQQIQVQQQQIQQIADIHRETKDDTDKASLELLLDFLDNNKEAAEMAIQGLQDLKMATAE